jgi:4-hydroxy-2-oxoheptanedioate aldolase
MRPSRVLGKMRAGKVAFSVKLNMCDPRIAEMAALCGVDAVWLDLEHVPNSISDIENMIRAAKMHNADSIVRVPRGSYTDLIRPLEMDAAGIMVPHVLSAEDARRVAWHTKFHPIGRRPLDGGNADGAFCMLDEKTYVEQANRERLVIVQIEDPEPVEELDEIAAIEGIDMLFFGPGDFSHGIGRVGEHDHPMIGETSRKVVEAAHRHGKFAGTVGSLENYKDLVEQGYDYLNVGGDTRTLGIYFEKVAEETRDVPLAAPQNV